MLSKRYCTGAFLPFFSRPAAVFSVCHSLGLFQGSADVGLYASWHLHYERRIKSEKTGFRSKIFLYIV